MKKIIFIAAIAAASVLTGCVTPKNITYMQGFDNGMAQTVREVKRLKVQPDDQLSIVVSAKDPELAQVFNLTVAQMRVGQTTDIGTSQSSGQVTAYTVSPDGNINFPILGTLHVAGLERREIASMIEQSLDNRGLLSDPVVTVSFLNAGVSVIGDVSRPGEYTIDRDNMTLLQAIAKAGDLNITGMRNNVLVVREDGGQDMAYRVDLTNTEELMQSPAYYVQQNDVIYVEPNNTKKRTASANGNNVMTPGFWISIASFVSTIAVLICK